MTGKFLNPFQCKTLQTITTVFFLLFMPAVLQAASFYNCIDREGNASFSDHPVEGHMCEEIRTYENPTNTSPTANDGPGENRTTKIKTIGNSVLVPVRLLYRGNETDVHLVLDTGASGTTIHSDVSDRLDINLAEIQKAKGEVVGGTFIDASIVNMDSLKVGPHTFFKRNVFVIDHDNAAADFDGLLGMDLLKGLKFKIDFERQSIIWD